LTIVITMVDVVVVVPGSSAGAGWRNLVTTSTWARDHVVGRTRATTATTLSKSTESREGVDVNSSSSSCEVLGWLFGQGRVFVGVGGMGGDGGGVRHGRHILILIRI